MEYEPNRSFGTVIQDGAAILRSRMTFEPAGDRQTKVTISFSLPGMDESMDKSFLNHQLELSGEKRKQLIESET